VKENVPEAQFAIAGPGSTEYVRQLKGLANELGIRESVKFTGYVGATERLKALVDADLFILTSHTENFAMAAVEAMAAQTPVLLSEEVGVAEKAEAAGAGISVSLDESAIASQLARILKSKALREQMGQRGRAHVRSTYSPEAVGEQMINALQERKTR
jgi:glycosyltransferase involved in cell wall biosynthesis